MSTAPDADRFEAVGAPERTDALDRLVDRCTFPPPGTHVAAAFSGGPDSTALVALAVRHGLVVTAHHVDHALRPGSADDAERAGTIARRLDVEIVVHRHRGPVPDRNTEAAARAIRRALLPPGAMTGHTLDDQAETVLIRLLRGSGRDGLSGMRRGPIHPLLALRRADTESVCAELGIAPVRDPTNTSTRHLRNRIRHELLPLADEVVMRDVAPILARTADVLRDDEDLLVALAADLDPTDARAVAAAHPAIARRALRAWLAVDGYPPDAAAVERVLAVARGEAAACELDGGRRVARTAQRLRLG